MDTAVKDCGSALVKWMCRFPETGRGNLSPDKFCSVCAPNGVYTESGIDPHCNGFHELFLWHFLKFHFATGPATNLTLRWNLHSIEQLLRRKSLEIHIFCELRYLQHRFKPQLTCEHSRYLLKIPHHHIY